MNFWSYFLDLFQFFVEIVPLIEASAAAVIAGLLLAPSRQFTNTVVPSRCISFFTVSAAMKKFSSSFLPSSRGISITGLSNCSFISRFIVERLIIVSISDRSGDL